MRKRSAVFRIKDSAREAMTSARTPNPASSRLWRMTCSDRRASSMKTTLRAPLLRASIPMPPAPAKRSRKDAPFICSPRMLNSACLTLSEVGRTRSPAGTLSRLPRPVPPVTRICFPLSPGPGAARGTGALCRRFRPGRPGLPALEIRRCYRKRRVKSSPVARSAWSPLLARPPILVRPEHAARSANGTNTQAFLTLRSRCRYNHSTVPNPLATPVLREHRAL